MSAARGAFVSIYTTCDLCPRLPDFRSFVRFDLPLLFMLEYDRVAASAALIMTAAGVVLFSGLLAWHAHPPRPIGARRAPPPRLAGPWRHSRDSPTPAGGGHVVMDYEDFCVEAAPAADCADTYVPGPLHCTDGLVVPASCVHVPEAQGSLARATL